MYKKYWVKITRKIIVLTQIIIEYPITIPERRALVVTQNSKYTSLLH